MKKRKISAALLAASLAAATLLTGCGDKKGASLDYAEGTVLRMATG